MLLERLVSGEISVLFGTHAVLGEGVAFEHLGLVVIDEQHRFGVGQRNALRSKGPGADLLVMTATPIPRTLALSVYGDLDLSLIHIFMTGITQRVCYRMRREIIEKIDRMPLSYFERVSTGDVMSRVTNDVDTLGQSLNQSVTQLVTSIAQLVGVSIQMLSLSVALAGVTFLTCLLYTSRQRWTSTGGRPA